MEHSFSAETFSDSCARKPNQSHNNPSPKPETHSPHPKKIKKIKNKRSLNLPITNCIPHSCTKMPPFQQNPHQFNPNNNQNEKNSPAQTKEAHDWRIYRIKSGRNGDCSPTGSQNKAEEAPKRGLIKIYNYVLGVD